MPYQESGPLSWGDITVTRRTFLGKGGRLALGAAAVSLLGGCSTLFTPEEKTDIPEGIWSKEAVIAMAQSMIKETTLNDVAYAGYILLGNQQGQPTFSEQNPAVLDEPVILETKADLLSPYPGKNFLAGARVQYLGDSVEIVLKSRGQAEELHLSAPSQSRLENIYFAKTKIAGISALGVKFLLTKEIYNLRAQKMLVDYGLDSFSSRYILPSDPKELTALRVWMTHQQLTINGYPLPIEFATDVLAHYLLVLNYLSAKEAGRLNTTDLRLLGLIDKSADYFKLLGILSKKGGKYQWGQDNQVFYGWLDAVVWVHKDIFGSQKSLNLFQIWTCTGAMNQPKTTTLL